MLLLRHLKIHYIRTMLDTYETIAEGYLHLFEKRVCEYLVTGNINALREAHDEIIELEVDKRYFEWSRLEDYTTIVGQLLYAFDSKNEKILKMKQAQLLRFWNNV